MSVELVSENTLIDLFRLQFSKYSNVAALAVFVFDYCLTFRREVEYVWGTKWEITRIVFTLSRYLPFIASSLTCYDALVRKECGSFILALDALYTASILFAEGILILRTYALWGRNKRVLIVLLVLAGAFLAGAEVISTRFRIILPGDSTSPYQYYPSFCAYRSSRNGAFQYGFLVAYEIILQSMCTWRKFWTYRNARSRTLNTLYWDGIVYMSWVIALSGANMSMMTAAPITYIPALNTAQVALHSVLASRIFFNLKECDKQVHFITDISLEPLRYRARSTVGGTIQAYVHRVS